MSCPHIFFPVSKITGVVMTLITKTKTHLLGAAEWQCIRNGSAKRPHLPTCHEPFISEHLPTPSMFNYCFLKKLLVRVDPPHKQYNSVKLIKPWNQQKLRSNSTTILKGIRQAAEGRSRPSGNTKWRGRLWGCWFYTTSAATPPRAQVSANSSDDVLKNTGLMSTYEASRQSQVISITMASC